MKKHLAWTLGMVLIAIAALVPSEEVRAVNHDDDPFFSPYCSEVGCNEDSDCSNAVVRDSCSVCDTQVALITAKCSN